VRFVELGTTTISDCWCGYGMDQLCFLSYFHQMVNHSLYFRDPNTSIHTKTIEGT